MPALRPARLNVGPIGASERDVGRGARVSGGSGGFRCSGCAGVRVVRRSEPVSLIFRRFCSHVPARINGKNVCGSVCSVTDWRNAGKLAEMHLTGMILWFSIRIGGGESGNGGIRSKNTELTRGNIMTMILWDPNTILIIEEFLTSSKLTASAASGLGDNFCLGVAQSLPRVALDKRRRNCRISFTTPSLRSLWHASPHYQRGGDACVPHPTCREPLRIIIVGAAPSCCFCFDYDTARVNQPLTAKPSQIRSDRWTFLEKSDRTAVVVVLVVRPSFLCLREGWLVTKVSIGAPQGTHLTWLVPVEANNKIYPCRVFGRAGMPIKRVVPVGKISQKINSGVLTDATDPQLLIPHGIAETAFVNAVLISVKRCLICATLDIQGECLAGNDWRKMRVVPQLPTLRPMLFMRVAGCIPDAALSIRLHWRRPCTRSGKVPSAASGKADNGTRFSGASAFRGLPITQRRQVVLTPYNEICAFSGFRNFRSREGSREVSDEVVQEGSTVIEQTGAEVHNRRHGVANASPRQDRYTNYATIKPNGNTLRTGVLRSACDVLCLSNALTLTIMNNLVLSKLEAGVRQTNDAKSWFSKPTRTVYNNNNIRTVEVRPISASSPSLNNNYEGKKGNKRPQTIYGDNVTLRKLPQKDPPIQSRESNVAYSVAAISLFLPPPGAECDRFAAANASSRVRHSAEERRPEERRPWHRQELNHGMHGNLIENEFPVAWKNATCGGPFWPWEREGGDGGGRGERRCPRWARGAGESGAEDEESSGIEARGGRPGPDYVNRYYSPKFNGPSTPRRHGIQAGSNPHTPAEIRATFENPDRINKEIISEYGITALLRAVYLNTPTTAANGRLLDSRSNEAASLRCQGGRACLFSSGRLFFVGATFRTASSVSRVVDVIPVATVQEVDRRGRRVVMVQRRGRLSNGPLLSPQQGDRSVRGFFPRS
ncbi:hypothetical protein GEV33_011919 [Tenebrio molitor]|uniref:Uncharacterized protein n=1 Tax=Tenebrio molitor TaxID=7067 RepID=A0A8J6HB89_TENMO|nr:hypothetical protein GEV33_011919 [Tenebrio molitor]